jgi:pimeloyl-ACP methyl ester carboxylesterase
MTVVGASPLGAEQTRARYPDHVGVLERDGVRIHWESYGEGEPTILFLPPWSIVHSRCWKMQIPDFARHHRVLTFDGRGNGRSDRPGEPAAYAEDEFAADALGVLDATGTERVVLVALSLGAQRALIVAGEHPERVQALVIIGGFLDLGIGLTRGDMPAFDVDLGVDEGWQRYNAYSWRRDYPGFVKFFFEHVFVEPHSTKQIEDSVGWGLETDAQTLTAAEVPGVDEARTRALCARLTCPVLVIHGDRDEVADHAIGVEAARVTGGQLVTLEGSGHLPQARDPVRVNLLLRQFVSSLERRRR